MKEYILKSRDSDIVSYIIVNEQNYLEYHWFKDNIIIKNLEVLSVRKARRFYTGKIFDNHVRYVDIRSIFTKPELDDARRRIYSTPNNILQEIIMNPDYFDYVVSIAIEIGKADIENGIRMLNNLGAGIHNYLNGIYHITDHKFELAQRFMEQGLPVPDSSN